MTDKPKILSGVLAAALTPMTGDSKPNIPLLARHCRWLLQNGCDGLAILGTTGEANSFTVKERIALVDKLVEAGVPGDALMPGTGACALEDAIEVTRAAVKAGARGVLMLPPFYYKNVSDEGLFAFFSEVIEKIGESRFRLYLYHFPQMSGVPITYELIEMLRKRYGDTVAGMKDSSGVLENMVGAARNFPGFAVFSGADNHLLPLLKEGGAGCITACANVGSALAQQVFAGFKKGQNVDAANEKLCAVRKTISQFPLSAALKELMARHTGDRSWSNIRAPLVRLNKEKAKALFDGFDAIGFPLPLAA
ncbi:MAG: dihydrodipicolinate synthase family protein [Rhodospirillales bacterium]|nr:dihydrodipicolinate synthase family protein [Rhodospirillales bacterium]